jgi:hypothetical protein
MAGAALAGGVSYSGLRPMGVLVIKEQTMKTKHGLFFGFAVLLVTVIFSLSLTGCATVSSIGGTADTHGLISKANVVSEGSQAIASYSVILGLVDSGYEEYNDAVQQAQAAGKTVTSITKQYAGFFTKITAYAK